MTTLTSYSISLSRGNDPKCWNVLGEKCLELNDLSGAIESFRIAANFNRLEDLLAGALSDGKYELGCEIATALNRSLNPKELILCGDKLVLQNDNLGALDCYAQAGADARMVNLAALAVAAENFSFAATVSQRLLDNGKKEALLERIEQAKQARRDQIRQDAETALDEDRIPEAIKLFAALEDKAKLIEIAEFQYCKRDFASARHAFYYAGETESAFRCEQIASALHCLDNDKPVRAFWILKDVGHEELVGEVGGVLLKNGKLDLALEAFVFAGLKECFNLVRTEAIAQGLLTTAENAAQAMSDWLSREELAECGQVALARNFLAPAIRAFSLSSNTEGLNRCVEQLISRRLYTEASKLIEEVSEIELDPIAS